MPSCSPLRSGVHTEVQAVLGHQVTLTTTTTTVVQFLWPGQLSTHPQPLLPRVMPVTEESQKGGMVPSLPFLTHLAISPSNQEMPSHSDATVSLSHMVCVC